MENFVRPSVEKKRKRDCVNADESQPKTDRENNDFKHSTAETLAGSGDTESSHVRAVPQLDEITSESSISIVDNSQQDNSFKHSTLETLAGSGNTESSHVRAVLQLDENTPDLFIGVAGDTVEAVLNPRSKPLSIPLTTQTVVDKQNLDETLSVGRFRYFQERTYDDNVCGLDPENRSLPSQILYRGELRISALNDYLIIWSIDIDKFVLEELSSDNFDDLLSYKPRVLYRSFEAPLTIQQPCCYCQNVGFFIHFLSIGDLINRPTLQYLGSFYIKPLLLQHRGKSSCVLHT